MINHPPSFVRSPRSWRANLTDPGQFHDPVGLPGLSSIRRESLLPARRIGCDVGPDKSNIDAPALEHFLVIKLAPAILEPADHRRVHNPVDAVRPIEAPLLRFGVIKAQSHALDM